MVSFFNLAFLTFDCLTSHNGHMPPLPLSRTLRDSSPNALDMLSLSETELQGPTWHHMNLNDSSINIDKLITTVNILDLTLGETTPAQTSTDYPNVFLHILKHQPQIWIAPPKVPKFSWNSTQQKHPGPPACEGKMKQPFPRLRQQG